MKIELDIGNDTISNSKSVLVGYKVYYKLLFISRCNKFTIGAMSYALFLVLPNVSCAKFPFHLV